MKRSLLADWEKYYSKHNPPTGKYKVFSPNYDTVETKLFDNEDDAIAYYDHVVLSLGYAGDVPEGVQMQVDNPQGEMIEHGTFVGKRGKNKHDAD